MMPRTPSSLSLLSRAITPLEGQDMKVLTAPGKAAVISDEPDNSLDWGEPVR